MIEMKFSGTIEEVGDEICSLADSFRRAKAFTTQLPIPPSTGIHFIDKTPPVLPLKKRGRPAAKVEAEPPTEANGIRVEAEQTVKVNLGEMNEPVFGVRDSAPQEVTLDDIRAAAMQIMERRGSTESDKALGTEDVREWLRTAGVTRIRELQEKDYAPLMAYAQGKGWLK